MYLNTWTLNLNLTDSKPTFSISWSDFFCWGGLAFLVYRTPTKGLNNNTETTGKCVLHLDRECISPWMEAFVFVRECEGRKKYISVWVRGHNIEMYYKIKYDTRGTKFIKCTIVLKTSCIMSSKKQCYLIGWKTFTIQNIHYKFRHIKRIFRNSMILHYIEAGKTGLFTRHESKWLWTFVGVTITQLWCPLHTNLNWD